MSKRSLMPLPDGPGSCELDNGWKVSQQTGQEPYAGGSLLSWALLQARADERALDEVVDTLLPWLDHLLNNANGNKSELSDCMLPGQYVDCTPFNLIQTTDGLAYIDQEWVLDREAPLGWVLCRGVANSLSKGVLPSAASLSIAQLVTALCTARQLSIDEPSIEAWLALESDFQHALTGHRPDLSGELRPGNTMIPVRRELSRVLHDLNLGSKPARRRNGLALLVHELSAASSKFEDQRRKSKEAQQQLASVKERLKASERTVSKMRQSTSWRLTRPVRALSKLMKRSD